MQRKDLLEIKKRFKKNECTFTRMTGCYVNATKEKVTSFSNVFLNLPDEEYYKYLEIAKKTLSGTIGNQLLELSFPMEEESGAMSKQQFFMGLKASALKDEGLLERFYDLVIDSYDYTGNYLILLFHDAYDVITKTEDNLKLDESEEVYEYILCSLCPVTLSKPGLGYLEEENKIGVRLRDWIVAPPENGFLFPAFTDRSSDIHSLLYFTKNTKEPHEAFMENGLGCPAKRTSMQQKKAFENVVKQAVGDDEATEEVFLKLQDSLCTILDRQEEAGNEDTPIELNQDVFHDVITDSDISESLAPKIEKAFAAEFTDALPTADALLDNKAVAKNEQRKVQKALITEVATLKEALSKAQIDPEQLVEGNYMNDVSDAVSGNMGDITDDAASETDLTGNSDINGQSALCDVFLRMKPERASLVTEQMIDGQKCLIIPVEDDDDIDLNGIKL